MVEVEGADGRGGGFRRWTPARVGLTALLVMAGVAGVAGCVEDLCPPIRTFPEPWESGLYVRADLSPLRGRSWRVDYEVTLRDAEDVETVESPDDGEHLSIDAGQLEAGGWFYWDTGWTTQHDEFRVLRVDPIDGDSRAAPNAMMFHLWLEESLGQRDPPLPTPVRVTLRATSTEGSKTLVCETERYTRDDYARERHEACGGSWQSWHLEVTCTWRSPDRAPPMP